jgi:regulator of protease activity HflC (stomatin/prohibitin superfamily)
MAAQDKAEAEKIMIVKAAEADAEAKYLAGVGIARQRQAIVSGIQESMSAFNQKFNSLNPQTVMDLIIVTQYFDTLKDIGSHSKSNTIFIPSDTGDVGKIASQMRNGLLQAQTMIRD